MGVIQPLIIPTVASPKCPETVGCDKPELLVKIAVVLRQLFARTSTDSTGPIGNHYYNS